MSGEGVTLLLRGLLVLVLIIAGAIVRTFIGPRRTRGYIMLAGMLTGMAVGARADARDDSCNRVMIP